MEEQTKSKNQKAKTLTGQRPRIVFSHSVRVNIGDYEHQECFISVSDDVQDDETHDEAYARIGKFVMGKLKSREKRIRLKSREHVDFDTKAKLEIK